MRKPNNKILAKNVNNKGLLFPTKSFIYRFVKDLCQTLCVDINSLIFSQVYHDLLRSEEEFVNELRHVVDNYLSVLDASTLPEEVGAVKKQIAMNLKELCNFHAK